MSRADAHVPHWIRVARGDIPRTEVHDHTDGVCDLPDPFDPTAWASGPGHCHWTWLWDGHRWCPCELCHCGDLNRRERRAERQRVGRQLRAAALRPDLADEF